MLRFAWPSAVWMRRLQGYPQSFVGFTGTKLHHGSKFPVQWNSTMTESSTRTSDRLQVKCQTRRVSRPPKDAVEKSDFNPYLIVFRTSAWTASRGSVVFKGRRRSIPWQAINSSIASTENEIENRKMGRNRSPYVLLVETKLNEFVTIAVNRNLSNCEKARKKRISGLQRDSNPWPLR